MNSIQDQIQGRRGRGRPRKIAVHSGEYVLVSVGEICSALASDAKIPVPAAYAKVIKSIISDSGIKLNLTINNKVIEKEKKDKVELKEGTDYFIERVD